MTTLVLKSNDEQEIIELRKQLARLNAIEAKNCDDCKVRGTTCFPMLNVLDLSGWNQLETEPEYLF